MSREPSINIKFPFWDDTVKVTRIDGPRHFVIFMAEGDRESCLSFCNRCGSSFTNEDGSCAECSPVEGGKLYFHYRKPDDNP